MSAVQQPETRYAGFWRRLGAGLIDAVLYTPLFFPVTWLETQSRPAAFLSVILGPALFYFYILAMTARYGATLGKMAVGVRVVPADGTALMWRHVWLRSSVDLVLSGLSVAATLAGLSRVPYAAYRTASWEERSEMVESALPLYPWLMGFYFAWLLSEFVVIFLNRRRRAIHDFIAGTVVIVTSGRSQGPALAGGEVRVGA